MLMGMMQEPNHLFVYGTLMSTLSHPMGTYLASYAELVGTGFVQGELYDLGEYPGLIETKDEKHQVFGEIYEIYDKVRLLHRLDEYEGCANTQPKPHLYERRTVSVKLTGEQDIMAWTYFYTRNLISKKRILSGDYTAYVNAPSKTSRFIKVR